jgi:hypothetical protein
MITNLRGIVAWIRRRVRGVAIGSMGRSKKLRPEAATNADSFTVDLKTGLPLTGWQKILEPKSGDL